MSTNIYAKSVIKALLAHSDYDAYGRNDKTISASSFSKSIRQLAFDILYPEVRSIIRPDQSPASKLGSGFHFYAEKLFDNVENIADFFVDALADTDSLDISQEVRKDKNIKLTDGSVWTITGKYDLVINGQVMDWKTSTVFGYTTESNVSKYVEQGSVYKWLNPDKITSNTVSILYLLKDWSYVGYLRALKKGDTYPDSGIFAEDYQLLPVEQTEEYIKKTLEKVNKAVTSADIPLCTDVDLWVRTSTTWKFYKDFAPNKRATKNFTNPEEAYAYMKMNSTGCKNPKVKEIKTKSEPNACYYCKHNVHCTQYATMNNTNK